MTKKNRTQWVMGNWKMNPVTGTQAHTLCQNLTEGLAQDIRSNVNMVIAPSFLHIATVSAEKNDNIVMMAQDVCANENNQGAFTGDVSASQLKDAGVSLVLVGHSERREYQKENTSILINKINHVLETGLTAVFCVGEQLAERQSEQHFSVVEKQIRDVLTQISFDVDNLVVAYEPVWAIGTGLSASKDDAQAMHAHIRSVLTDIQQQYAQVSILYGGSVKPANAPELAACDDIDGVLVGGASLDAAQFLDIYRAFG